MTKETEQDLFDAIEARPAKSYAPERRVPAGSDSCPAPGSAPLDLEPAAESGKSSGLVGVGGVWKEDWFNSDLRFCDVAPEARDLWLKENFAWLYSGRRWPMSPTESVHRHCLHWWPRVEKLMEAHGWWWEHKDDPITGGYVVTWHRGAKYWASKYRLGHTSNSAPYAAVIAAILVRRKARYYKLWGGGGAELVTKDSRRQEGKVPND